MNDYEATQKRSELKDWAYQEYGRTSASLMLVGTIRRPSLLSMYELPLFIGRQLRKRLGNEFFEGGIFYQIHMHLKATQAHQK
jgi:hypothetical protein